MEDDGVMTGIEIVDVEEQKHQEPKKEEEKSVLYEAIDKLDKDIFFTATSAKNKTVAVHKKRLEVEMLPIYQKINGAISNGQYEIDNIELSKSQREFLKAKNFGVGLKTSTNPSNGDVYRCKIYWNY